MWTWDGSLDSIDDTDWTRLLWASQRPTPFLSRSFLAPWAASFAPDRPLRVGRYLKEGIVRALVLLYQAEDRWELLGGQDVADRLDMLVEPEWEEEATRAFLEAGWDRPLRLPNLAPDSCLYRWVPRLTVGWSKTQTDSNPVLPLPTSFEDYLRSLSKHQRHELRRKMRRAERLGGPLSFVQDRTGVGVGEFLRLHRASHPDKHAFMDSRMENFFRGLLAGWAREGVLRLALLESRGQALAAMLQVSCGKVLHLYNSGFDPAYRELAPGVVLLGMCLQNAIAEGFVEYDLLRGTERYKYELGGQDRPVWRLDVG